MKICNNIHLPITYCDCKENECKGSPFKNNDMKKQTAVEWLIEQLDEQVYRIDYKDNRINISISFQDMITIRKQAKAMEKEQIKDAYQKGDWDESYLEENKIWAEQYYNETYKDETT